MVLPSSGLQRGIYAAVLGDLALAALLFAVAPELPRRRWAGRRPPRWRWRCSAWCSRAGTWCSFSPGFFRISIARDYISRKMHKHDWETPKLVFYEDGIATTVSVDQWDKTYSLKNNGKVDASNDADMPTQIIVGLLPLLFYHRPTSRPRWRWSASARASPPARSPSTRSRRWRWSSWSRPSTAASHFFDDVQPPPAAEPQGHARASATGATS